MHFKKIILSSLLSFSSLSYAKSSVGIDINNNDVGLLASLSLNSLATYSDGTNYLLDLNYLHTKDDEDTANMTSVSVMGQNTLQGVESLQLAFGLKAVFISDFLAVPFTFKGDYTLPLIDQIPTTTVALSLSYAPSTLTFRDGESYSDVRLEADMEIIHNIHLFTGYRNISTEYKKDDKTFNSSVYGGIKLTF
jgi:hypothetical protein